MYTQVKHLQYRPDIDGLRAVAVVPVVLFHAGASIFGGGYVGVDVFFVISGYLITSIIASEIDVGSFSIAIFYQRRIRRIFPALIAVLLFCITVGYFILTPRDYQNLGESILAASLFVSNIFFWKATGYFSAPSSEMPLLHTWSLAIEEQFYVFFPIFLYILSRYFSRVRNRAVIAVCVASFVVATILINYKPSATFFLGFSRAWELLIGCLIALGAIRPVRSAVVNYASALFGLVCVVVPMFMYSASTTFPGVSALPPVVGTGLLIWSGQNRTPIHSLLSTRPFVAIGKASYSLYLWHFPLLAFGKYLTLRQVGAYTTAAICVASLTISFLSLQFIERPFRRPSRPVRVGRLVTVAVTVMVLVTISGGAVYFNNGLPERLDAAAKQLIAAEDDVHKHHLECMSVERIVTPQHACHLGAGNAVPSVLLWGDSHAAVTATALQFAAARHGASFLFAASVDCPIGIGFSISIRGAPAFVNTPGYKYCGHYNADMLKLALQNQNIKTVVLSSRWTNWRIGEPGALDEKPVDIRLKDSAGAAISAQDNKRIFAAGFESLIKRLTAAGKTVWIVGPIPLPNVRVPQALFVKRFGLVKLKLDINYNAFQAQNAWILSFFERVARDYPVQFIWPDVALCHQGVCKVSDEGRPLYFDDNHLSVFGAEKTSYLYDVIFMQRFSNPLSLNFHQN